NVAVGAIHVQPYCQVAKYGEPHEAESRRCEQYANDELAYRSATRNAGDEHADKWRPRNPPSPVKKRPVADPGRRFVRIDVKRACDERVNVQADVFDKRAEQETRRAEYQDAQHEHHRDDDDEFAEP